MIDVTSSAFGAGKQIPQEYTGEGKDISPPLAWSGVPPETKELALICDDPDAPMAEPFVHWVLYKIPAGTESLPEGSSAGAVEGANSFGNLGYGGPMPPPGHGTHHYHFRVYALDQPVDLKPGAGKPELLNVMQGHIIAQGELVGTYER